MRLAVHLRREDVGEVRVLMRPMHTKRAPLLDEFGRKFFEGHNIKVIAREWKPERLTVEETFDRMLLVLHDALFLEQCDVWTRGGYANLDAGEATELARWFLLGQNVGRKPLMDGICAMCGMHLYGHATRTMVPWVTK